MRVERPSFTPVLMIQTLATMLLSVLVGVSKIVLYYLITYLSGVWCLIKQLFTKRNELSGKLNWSMFIPVSPICVYACLCFRQQVTE